MENKIKALKIQQIFYRSAQIFNPIITSIPLSASFPILSFTSQSLWGKCHEIWGRDFHTKPDARSLYAYYFKALELF